jgi:hypothetical protein
MEKEKFDVIYEHLMEEYTSADFANALSSLNDVLQNVWSEMQRLADDSYLYQGLSFFDPTGIMSYPYLKEALDNWEKDPSSKWNNAILFLSALACLPVMGFGAKTILKIPLLPILLPFRLVEKIAGLIRGSTRITESILPKFAARSFGKKIAGSSLDSGATFIKLLENNGIQLSEKAIAREAEKAGIKLDSNYLKTLSNGGKLASKTLGKLIGVLTKTAAVAGKLARPVVAGNAMKDNFIQNHQGDKSIMDALKSLSTKSTPTTYRTPRSNLVGKIGSR